MKLANTWIHDFGKFKMVLDENDVDVSNQIKEYGWYKDEEFETSVFAKYLKEGMTVLDLGANVGFYTILARSIIGPRGRIIAFEPFPRNAEILEASIKENSFENVTLVKAAVADKTGRATFYLSPDANSEHSLLNLEFKYESGLQSKRTIEVMVHTIDDYLEKNVGDLSVDFIKMDIEGSEIAALKGMRRVLEENKHLVLMSEFWPNGFKKNNSDPKEFLESLDKLNFDIYHMDNEKKEVYRVSIDEMMKIVNYRIKNIPEENEVMKFWGWYTNLLFVR